jgi:hypothetical protein
MHINAPLGNHRVGRCAPGDAGAYPHARSGTPLTTYYRRSIASVIFVGARSLHHQRA